MRIFRNQDNARASLPGAGTGGLSIGGKGEVVPPMKSLRVCRTSPVETPGSLTGVGGGVPGGRGGGRDGELGGGPSGRGGSESSE